MKLLGWLHRGNLTDVLRLPEVEREVADIGPSSSTVNDYAVKAHVRETERLLEVQKAHIRAIQERGGQLS